MPHQPTSRVFCSAPPRPQHIFSPLGCCKVGPGRDAGLWWGAMGLHVADGTAYRQNGVKQVLIAAKKAAGRPKPGLPYHAHPHGTPAKWPGWQQVRASSCETGPAGYGEGSSWLQGCPPRVGGRRHPTSQLPALPTTSTAPPTCCPVTAGSWLDQALP